MAIRISPENTTPDLPARHSSVTTRAAPLGLHRTERRLFLLVVDLVAINTALLTYLIARGDHAGLGLPESTPLDLNLLWARPGWFLLLSAAWLLAAQAFDAYRLQTANRFASSAAAVLKSAIIVLLFYVAVPYLTPTLPPSRSYLIVLFGTTIGLLLLVRSVYVLALGRSVFRRPTLIVGTGWAGQTIARELLQNDDGTHLIVGFIGDKKTPPGTRLQIADTRDGKAGIAPIDQRALTVLGDSASLKDLVERHHIRTIVLAATDELDPELLRVLMDCLEFGAQIIPMSQLYERLTGRVPVEHVGDDWHLAMPLEHPGTGTLRPLAKRAFDLVSASVGLILLAPFVPLIALAIRIESRGPIFYTQRRVGKGGRVFKVFKFRSMRSGAEEDDAVWSQPGDARVTRVGAILRATHVDEFPQFLNILRGEMSAVGPRPERPEFLERLIADIPFYTVRHAVRPGMAGWALVNCGYGSSIDDALRKLQYDLYYIKHQSVSLDLVILLKTILHSLGLQGR